MYIRGGEGMLIGRQLLEYERALNRITEIKEQLHIIEQAKDKLINDQNNVQIELQKIEVKSDSIDKQIEKALAEQQLIIIQKDLERLEEHDRHNNFQIMQEQIELEHKIDITRSSLSEDVWERYNRIKENVENAVVEVKHQMCTGCFMALSKDNLSQWRRGKKIVLCNVCGRILA